MPFNAVHPPGRHEVIDQWDGGVGWLAYPGETMRRASHALRLDPSTDSDAPASNQPADVWLIDPLRAPGIDEHLDSMGSVVGVLVLIDRHTRDAAGFARRYDVPLYVPTWIDIDVPDDVGIVRIDEKLPSTGYELLETVDLPGWHEAALYDGDTLVVGDALGTVEYFTTPSERIGVHPFLRLMPPNAFQNLDPKRILTGHGTGITSGGERALESALSRSRRDAPRLYLEILKSLVMRQFA